MKKKVGIITFHASYNHGSVFQAQATQQAIQNLGYDAEIIDYRPKTYDDYDRLYCRRGHSGIKGRLYYALLRIHRTQRLERIQKFQQYQHENLCLSQKRYLTYDSLSEIANAYDMFVSGSDQIWSKNVPEIAIDSERAVLAYYLGFTQRKKIAYASSVASMKEKDLKEFQSYLMDYAYISTREAIGAERLQHITGRDITTVVDPSFLLDHQEWIHFAEPRKLVDGKYVLLYSLRNYVAEKNWSDALNIFAEQHGLKIVVIAPYFERKMKNAIDMRLAGPKEFLRLYADAEVVCTDTFHGTAFAVNFQKPVYSLGNKYWKGDIRKTSLLKALHMESRLINDESDLLSIEDYRFDYREANAILERQREESICYLRHELKD